MAEEKDQALEKQSTETEEKEPTSLDEFFDLGFKDIEKDEAAKEEKKKEEPKVEEKKVEVELAPGEELCAECPDGKKKIEGYKPYKTIKRKGETIEVHTEKEYEELASKGLDYTKKTQELATDRKEAETDYQRHADEMKAMEAKFNAMAINFEERGILPSTKTEEEKPKTKEEIYKEYGVDEEYAEPWQHRLIDDITEQRKELKELKQKNLQNEGFIKNIVTKEATTAVAGIITKAREEYPFEEIYDDKGNNLTAAQFVQTLNAKVEAAKKAGEAVNIAEYAIETVKQFSDMQSKTAEQKGPEIEANMSVDDFKAKYPELYSKTLEHGKDQGVAEYLDGKTDSAPSLTHRKEEVDTSKKKSVSGDMGEIIDQAFKEIDFTEKE